MATRPIPDPAAPHGLTRAERRAQNRRNEYMRRYAEAHTPQQLLNIEFDRVRSALTDLAARNPTAGARGLNELTGLLHSLAEKAERTAAAKPPKPAPPTPRSTRPPRGA